MHLLIKRLWFLALLSVSIAAVLTVGRGWQAQTPLTLDVQGQFLAVISDGDFFASTYADNRIPGDDPRYQDALTILPLPFTGEAISVEVSNSVNGPPEAMVLSPDGEMAFVIEYVGQRPAGATSRTDLPTGRMLSQVDLTNPKQPQVIDQIEVGPFPEAIAVHPDGSWLAIATDSGEAEVLQLVPIQNSTLGAPIDISLESLGISAAEGPLNASSVEWHPSGNYLAVNLYRQNRIVFLQFTPNPTSGEASLTLWGEPVMVDLDPYSGRFTPDGRYFISANWKRNFEATSLEDRLPSEPSTLSVIRLDIGNAALEDQLPQHRVLSTVATDLSSEGIAISPDGTVVATANMRATAFPVHSPRFTRTATVSLLDFNAESGQLTKAGEFEFEGVLPEGISFDVTGDHLIVATFEYLNSAEPSGGLEVWRVNRQPGLTLDYVGRINVPHGAHQVAIAS